MAEGPNTALVREGIDAFNRHDVEAVLALLTEDVEWQRVDGLPDGGGLIRGREAVRELMRPEAFERMAVEPRAIVETYVVYWFDDGLVRRVENYTARETAERAASLSLD